MKRKQRIEKIILNNFSEFLVEICDNSQLHAGHNNFNGIGETHIEILLTRDTNSHKINRLEIHKKINELLKEEFDNGLHSLQITIN